MLVGGVVPGLVAGHALARAQGSRAVDHRHRRDHRLRICWPAAECRSGRCRRDPGRAARVPAARSSGSKRSSRAWRRSRSASSSSASPMRSSVARSFAGRHGQHIRPAAELTAMGAASLAGSGQSGDARRCERFPDRGERSDGRPDAGCRPARRRRRRFGPALPHRTHAVPAQGDSRRRHRRRSIGLIGPAAWRGLARVSKSEVVIAAITMIGVIVIGVLPALLLAIALAVIDVIRRSATPHDAVLGWVERLRRHADVRSSLSKGDPRRAHLPPGRPAVLRERHVRPGPDPGSRRGRAQPALVRVRCRGPQPCRRHRNR